MLVCSYSVGHETPHAESINKASVKCFNTKIVVKKELHKLCSSFLKRADSSSTTSLWVDGATNSSFERTVFKEDGYLI